jgi:hypothetical protein
MANGWFEPTTILNIAHSSQPLGLLVYSIYLLSKKKKKTNFDLVEWPIVALHWLDNLF